MLHADNIPGDNFPHQAFGRVLHCELFGHQVERVQCVDGEFDENRTRRSRLGDGQGFSESRHDFSDGPDGGTELTQRLEEGHLVDVLQSSSALYDRQTTATGEILNMWLAAKSQVRNQGRFSCLHGSRN